MCYTRITYLFSATGLVVVQCGILAYVPGYRRRSFWCTYKELALGGWHEFHGHGYENYGTYYLLIELTCDLNANEGSLGFIVFNNFWLGRQGTAMLWVDKERREINEKARQNWQNQDK